MVEDPKAMEAGEMWVTYEALLHSSFWISVNPLSIKIYTEPSKISTTTSQIPQLVLPYTTMSMSNVI